MFADTGKGILETIFPAISPDQLDFDADEILAGRYEKQLGQLGLMEHFTEKSRSV